MVKVWVKGMPSDKGKLSTKPVNKKMGRLHFDEM